MAQDEYLSKLPSGGKAAFPTTTTCTQVVSRTADMKITYHVATSLDGFIARDDGDVSWLDDMNIDMDETGLEAFFADIGGLVMGRKTYDFIFDYGSWPYENKPSWVFTHRKLQILKGANLIAVDNIDNFLVGVSRRSINHIWLVGGGRLASSFLARGLLTNISISEMPIDLGSGIPLFSDHVLDEFVVETRVVVEKNGFRQIDMTVKSDITTN